MRMRALPSGLVEVTFEWDPRFGECYECGVPAAYYVGEKATGTFAECEASMRHRTNGSKGCQAPEAHSLRPEALRCAVCAAQAAVNGDGPLQYLFREEAIL